MSKKLRIVAVIGVLVIGVVAAIGTTSAVPPTPERYYEVAPAGKCSECAPTTHRGTCQLTDCLATIPPGGALCQYDCFPN